MSLIEANSEIVNLAITMKNINIYEFLSSITENAHYNFVSTLTIKHLNILNIIIGSHIHPNDIKNPEFNRFHEFPIIVQKMFTNPLDQLGPDMIEIISNIDELHIFQTLYLCDPLYATSPNPIQLLNILSELQSQYESIKINFDGTISIFHHIKITEARSLKIYSVLKPIIVPFNVEANMIENIIPIINTYSKFNPLVAFIMDCTSYITDKMFVNDPSTNVFFTQSKCLIIDSEIQNIPMITISDISTKFTKDLDMQDNIRYRLIIRWIKDSNCDMQYLPLWRLGYDKDLRLYNAFKYLSEYYKFRKLHIELTGLIKLWTLFSMTCEYTMPKFNNLKHVKCLEPLFGTAIKLNQITFGMFLYLYGEVHFTDHIYYRSGSYLKENMVYFINKYLLIQNPDTISHELSTKSMDEICKLHTINILEGIVIHSPDAIGYYENDKIDRKFLIDLLEAYQIRL